MSIRLNPRRGGTRSPAAKLGMALAALMAAAIGVAVIVKLQDAQYKAWVIVVGLALAPTVLAIAKRPKEILLFGWIFSLTYNRQYYVFSSIVGYNGTQGPYVMLSDVCLLALFGFWAYERFFGRPKDQPRGASLSPWFAPFAAICFLSAIQSARPDWGMYEMIRISKIGLVLFYVRRNFGRREWGVSFAAIAAAVSFQSAVAMKELLTGRAGVIGLSSVSGEVPSFLKHFAEGAFTSGIVRGVGTLAHPPYLACYLLLALPVLLALTLTAPRPRAWWFGAAFLLGCGGLAATLSRGPWLLAVGQVGLLVAVLVWLRQLSIQRALGLAIIGGFVMMMALLPVKDKLMNRITGDFSESLRYREQGMQAAWKAVDDHPLLGLGLNNTEMYLTHYLPDMDWALVTEKFAAETLHLRAPIALGNGFMHVAEETGMLGLGAFLIFAFGVFLTGIRSAAWTTGEQRAICVGMMVGILGALGEQFVDTPLWVDPVLFTFTLYVGLLGVALPIFWRAPGTGQLLRLEMTGRSTRRTLATRSERAS